MPADNAPQGAPIAPYRQPRNKKRGGLAGAPTHPAVCGRLNGGKFDTIAVIAPALRQGGGRAPSRHQVGSPLSGGFPNPLGGLHAPAILAGWSSGGLRCGEAEHRSADQRNERRRP